MPTYEYQCEHCGHEFEKFQNITEPRLKKCPKCSHKVKRLLGTGAGIIFKGSGFYQTDYRSRSYKEAAKKETSSVSSDTSKSSSGGGKAKKE